MKEALRAMIESGMAVQNFDAALESLLKINATAACSPSALETFLDVHGYEKKFFPIAMAIMREPLSHHDEPVDAVPHALEMLKDVGSRHRMAIVTVGVPSLQFSKLKKAGIDPSLFCKISVIEEKNKKPIYRSLMDQEQLPSQEVVVCGDRPALDLVPAKELLCHTVHLERGRGRNRQGPEFSSGVIDYAIEDWLGFTAHLDRLEKLSIGHT